MTLDWILSPSMLGLFCVLAAILLGLQARRDLPTRPVVWGRRVAAAALIAVIGLAPSTLQTVTTTRPALNVAILIDRTTSMQATDMPGGATRLAVAARDLADVAAQLAGARFLVMSIDARQTLLLPWTTDEGALTNLADTLTPEIAYGAHGSQVAPALRRVLSQLDAASQEGGTPALLVLTDGEGTTLPDLSLPGAGAVVSYGTPQGATMLPYLGVGVTPTAPVTDPDTGEPAVSRADPAGLAAWAHRLGLTAVNRGDGETLTNVLTGLRDAAQQTTDADRRVPRHLIWPLVWLLVGWMAWEAHDVAHTWRRRRDQAKHARTWKRGA